jgi:hypothetical protein
MNVIFPIIELIDRLAIAEIKHEKTQKNQAEVDWYKNAFSKYDFQVINTDYESLKDIHRKIWGLEAELKSYNEHLLALEEIGRRAIEIRNYNHSRIELKNSIAAKLNCQIREFKSDHLSE